MFLLLFQDTQSEDEQATLQQRNSHLSQFWSLVTNAIKDTPSGSMLRDLALLELPIVMIDMPSSDEAKVSVTVTRGYVVITSYPGHTPLERVAWY